MFDGDLIGESAREYLRVSKDRSGVLQSPRQQHQANERHAERWKWSLGDPYEEVEALSASRYATRARAGFERLVADLEAGRFGARILILWEPSRGSRKAGEWVRLVDACQALGVLVYVTSHGRAYDPRRHRDRRNLLEDALDAEEESGKISDRTRRGTDSAAEAGLPHGITPFGYRRRYDEVTRQLIVQEPHPEEAPLIRELYRRLHGGESLRSVAADWDERGIRTRGAGSRAPRPFTPEHLRALAMHASYTGYRVHVPGRKAGVKVYGLDRAAKGAWEPLVSLDLWLGVTGMLSEPSRRSHPSLARPGAARHLLTRIAVCHCGVSLDARVRGTRRLYVCRDAGHVSIPADELDKLAEEEVFAYLEREDVLQALKPAEGAAPELQDARDKLALEVASLDDWRAKARKGAVSADSFAAIEPGILERVTALEIRVKTLSLPASLGGIEPGTRVRKSWADALLPARRRALRMLFSPGMMGTLTVGPSPYRYAPVELRVTWVRKPAT